VLRDALVRVWEFGAVPAALCRAARLTNIKTGLYKPS
jgi:hypothetical protein